ncbi:hypothetical protein E4U19_005823 [Claviceps sp. Clav32 group G5]|nr:hypothetical protein E4U40_000281 [Claviceps sp. LM458 group G5]KAG6039502.1 hypothetical protein E4U19_005823 [Claviceps sp. Clav32 group G5]KAG6050902.1 hypothetical protein E4U39_002850 [Claviceps sp. Clav50 group G5]
MDRLPRELIDAILRRCVAQGPKNNVLQLRLVCRLFDRVLKPSGCCTLGLELSRLSRASHVRRPDPDALQTIGYHCKSLYIDLMVLRDEMEVDYLETVFARVPTMAEFCQSMRRKYCMNKSSFTETEYYHTVESLLFNCRQIDRLRLNLPFQLVGRHCNAATMILANTLKALASRPEEDSACLKTLVLENVADMTIISLWLNPTDVGNIMKVFADLHHLVLTLRRHDVEAQRAFRYCFWDVIEHADRLETLCLVGMDHDDRPPRGLKQTRFWQIPVEDWRVRSLPTPRTSFSNLTCLELKRLEMLPEAFLKATTQVFGETLVELYLNEIYLKTEQSNDWNQDSRKVLWVGIPNQRPDDDCQWIAMRVRAATPRLKVCRASFLAYDHYLREDIAMPPEFDLIDPCGLGRSISQRFVEVVLGVHQPNSPNGDPVLYFPHEPSDDSRLLYKLWARKRAPFVEEYDTNAYQVNLDNPTSGWQKSLDGIFVNSNAGTLDELHYIAQTACQGMNEIDRRTAASGVAVGHAGAIMRVPGADDGAVQGTEQGTEQQVTQQDVTEADTTEQGDTEQHVAEQGEP